MSNCSEDLRARMLAALAQEAAVMAEAIALLGAVVSNGGAGDHLVIALQSFDYLTQQAQAQAGLIGLAAQTDVSLAELTDAIAAVPLPAMRERLLLALGAEVLPVAPLSDDGIFWMEA